MVCSCIFLTFRVVFSFLSTSFSLCWDMVMDWGFALQSSGTFLLRGRGLLVGGGKRYPYYLLIFINTVLRFTWTIPTSNVWMILLIAFGEVIRRSLWALFRLEHEHLNNCGEFKAMHTVEDFGISPPQFNQTISSNEADLFPHT